MEKLESLKVLMGVPSDFNEKEEITLRCLEIAKATDFSTDYKDMYEHLFTNNNFELCFVMDDKGVIYGFGTFDIEKKRSNAYIHGIIMHPEIQGYGFSKKIINEVLKKHNSKFLSARTHNPRIYEILCDLAIEKKMVFPNLFSEEIPNWVFELLSFNSSTNISTNRLIVENAYPDEKIMQSVKNKQINTIFERLNARDALVVLVATGRTS